MKLDWIKLLVSVSLSILILIVIVVFAVLMSKYAILKVVVVIGEIIFLGGVITFLCYDLLFENWRK